MGPWGAMDRRGVHWCQGAYGTHGPLGPMGPWTHVPLEPSGHVVDDDVDVGDFVLMMLLMMLLMMAFLIELLMLLVMVLTMLMTMLMVLLLVFLRTGAVCAPRTGTIQPGGMC